MTVTVTYRDAISFYNRAKEYLNLKDRKPSALTYALSRTIKLLENHIQDYNDLISDAEAEYQSKDKDGVFQYHDINCKIPKFTAANHTAFRKRYREIQETTFTYAQYLAKDVPNDLEVAWYDYFVPFVIDNYPGETE